MNTMIQEDARLYQGLAESGTLGLGVGLVGGWLLAVIAVADFQQIFGQGVRLLRRRHPHAMLRTVTVSLHSIMRTDYKNNMLMYRMDLSQARSEGWLASISRPLLSQAWIMADPVYVEAP